MGERGKAGLCSGVAKPRNIYYTNELKCIISTDRRKRSRADRTGCIEGFSEAENYIENAMKNYKFH